MGREHYFILDTGTTSSLITTSISCTLNLIGISISPSSGPNGTIITLTVSVYQNTGTISSFGFDLTYDKSMFALQSTSGGSLTGGWNVAGNDISGGARVGGYAGGQPAIAACSSGSIAVITLQVICGTSGQICNLKDKNNRLPISQIM
jgi:hypothetical protein